MESYTISLMIWGLGGLAIFVMNEIAEAKRWKEYQKELENVKSIHRDII